MDYQIIVKVPFSAFDDLEAREKAKSILSNTDVLLSDEKVEKKLQRVFKDRPPERVVL
jgi:hypothetical protein